MTFSCLISSTLPLDESFLQLDLVFETLARKLLSQRTSVYCWFYHYFFSTSCKHYLGLKSSPDWKTYCSFSACSWNWASLRVLLLHWFWTTTSKLSWQWLTLLFNSISWSHWFYHVLLVQSVFCYSRWWCKKKHCAFLIKGCEYAIDLIKSSYKWSWISVMLCTLDLRLKDCNQYMTVTSLILEMLSSTWS